MEATASCYDGDCSKYCANSYVCSGGHSNSWWLRSSQTVKPINGWKWQVSTARTILKMKLSEDASPSMQFRFDTHNREAVNWALKGHYQPETESRLESPLQTQTEAHRSIVEDRWTTALLQRPFSGPHKYFEKKSFLCTSYFLISFRKGDYFLPAF